jgi:elongation factor G
MIKSRLNATPLVLQIPIGAEGDFSGVVDLVAMKALVWPGETKKGEDYLIEEIPANLAEKAKQARHELLETLAECDDVVMEKYLEGAELTEEEIIAGIRRATLADKATPVLTGSAFKRQLLDTNKVTQLLRLSVNQKMMSLSQPLHSRLCEIPI